MQRRVRTAAVHFAQRIIRRPGVYGNEASTSRNIGSPYGNVQLFRDGDVIGLRLWLLDVKLGSLRNLRRDPAETLALLQSRLGALARVEIWPLVTGGELDQVVLKRLVHPDHRRANFGLLHTLGERRVAAWGVRFWALCTESGEEAPVLSYQQKQGVLYRPFLLKLGLRTKADQITVVKLGGAS